MFVSLPVFCISPVVRKITEKHGVFLPHPLSSHLNNMFMCSPHKCSATILRQTITEQTRQVAGPLSTLPKLDVYVLTAQITTKT